VTVAAHTRRLVELRREHNSSFGGKSSMLGELLAAEIPVPPGFAVSTSAFHAFVEEAGLRGMIVAELSKMSADEVASVGAASHAIGEAMRSAPLPQAVQNEIAERYAELAEEAGVRDPPVAVRSSALGEDSQEATFAGQQETYLWVRGGDRLCDAVRDCWVSLYGPPALTYRARLGVANDAVDAAEEPAMGVAVQLMIDAEVSGVMFTCNPVTGDPSMVAVNASWGLGLAVVGGEVTPDDFLVSKITHEVVREHVNTKQIEYVPDAGGRGAVRVDVPEERRAIPCLDSTALETLVRMGRRIERSFGVHQDIEWAIARGGGLHVLQARPVSALPRRDDAPKRASAMSLVMNTFGAGNSDS
jgi:pyruvate, water dikinase